MKKFRDLSIKVKIPVLLGIAGLGVMALVCVFLLIPLRKQSLENSSEIARLTATKAGDRLAERINATAEVIRAFTGIVANMAETDLVPNENKREMLLKEMEMMVNSDKNLKNIWCTLEPDALDGMDSQFINRMGSNSQGVFSPWFADGEVIADEGDYEEDYYKVPKATEREYLNEPYWDEVNGKKTHMFSISIPVMLKGKFIGVAGTDFYVEELYRLIASLNLNTVGKLVTDQGTVAVYHDEEQIGEKAEGGNREILDKLSEGKMFEGMYRYNGEEAYKVYVPIHLGEGNKPWYYAVDIPKEEIFAQTRQTAGYLFIFCSIGVLLIGLSGWTLIQTILKNITEVTSILRELSQGHINLHIGEHKNQDEIGRMKKEMSRLVAGLKQTSDFAQKIGEGNLDAELRLMGAADVLGNSLLEMRRSLQNAEEDRASRAKEEEQRNWGTSGLAKFAELLRENNDNMEALSYSIISNMVKYLDANQGGIFVLNDADNNEEKILEMKACYAFDRKKFAEKQIHPGEGLVGTCYLEGEPIYMTELPNQYIHITSGLGDANPRAIFICPLKVNNQIFGVIELASFREFEQYQLDFIQKVSESIASTISTVRVNIRTERLLTQTRLQTEEMANQEEELRQNMEEMQAAQEELLRRNQESEHVHNALSEAMAENERQITKMNLVMEAAHIGLWDMEIVEGNPVNPNNTFLWSDKFREMLGYSGEADFPNLLSSWSDQLHPEDKKQTLDAFAAHLLDRTGKTPYDLKYRLRKKNDEYASFRAFGATIRDENGYALRVVGAIEAI